MKQTSETQNNDILNRIRENVERQTEFSPATTAPTEGPLSHDQILERLRQQMGDQTSEGARGSKPVDDYDISGFEIEGEEDDTTELIASDEGVEDVPKASVDPETKESEIEAIEQEDTSEAAEEGSLPWDTEEEACDEAETPIEDVHCDADEKMTSLPQEELTESDEPKQDDEEDEFDESLAEETLPQEQEALKKQIERFVEKTVEPDDVFDYFEGLDKKAAKEREALIEDSVIVENASIPASKETLAEDLQTDEVPEGSEGVPVTDEANKEALAVDEEVLPITPVAEQFFYGRTQEQTETAEAPSENETVPMDDTDINLLLALGKKQALEESIGFVRVREAKNNFYDPTDEESLGNHVFAYDGEEFHDVSQISVIKTRYRKEKKILWRRLLGTACLALLSIFVEYLQRASLDIPVVSSFLRVDSNYQMISLLLVIGGILLSIHPLLDGVRGFFMMRPNRFTPLSVIAFANVAYDIAVLLFFQGRDARVFNFAILAFLVVSVVGDIIRLTKEMITFAVISDPKEKFALEKADPTPEISREEKILLKRDLLVEKVSFVGKYFTRTARRSTAYAEYFVELLATLIVASFIAIGVAVLQKDLLAAMHAFLLMLVVCMPMQHLVGSYPFGRLAKILYRHDSAVIGEAVDREYVGANTVYLDDIEVFGHHGVSVSGLRTYNDANFYDVLYYASAVFSRIEGPLRYVLENSSREIEAAEEAEILTIHKNGIEALIDKTTTVLIGTADFMKEKHFPTKLTDEDAQKIANGELCILYLAMNDVLSAKFYMKYTITKRFETFVSEMLENNTKVGIRTLDPNVSEEMLSLLRKDKETKLSVIRPTLNDLVPIGRRSDSSIITAKNSHMIARILALCGRVKRVNRVCSLLRICSMLVAFLAAVIFVFTNRMEWVSSVAIVIYQLLWLIPSGVYTAAKLK